MLSARSLAARSFEAAMHLNLENIEGLLRRHPGDRLLDVGCDDGERTRRFARAAGASAVHGFEAVPERAEQAKARGIDVVVGDVTEGLPFPDSAFDAVVSNQVIEHVHDTDRFVAECFRVLAPGGVAVVSTENLASWHNVLAVVLGWQPFSLTNVSQTVGGLGNPLAVFRGQPHTQPPSWQHMRVFAYRGLKELFEQHGFDVLDVAGSGYFPLPAKAGRRDPRHSMFITVLARRPA